MSVRITGENTESSIKIKTGLKSVKKTELFVKISVGRNRVTIIALCCQSNVGCQGSARVYLW